MLLQPWENISRPFTDIKKYILIKKFYSLIFEHKNKLVDWYTKRYNINKLVYYETCNDIKDAIAREKQLKWWLRNKKDLLISGFNPERIDLSI